MTMTVSTTLAPARTRALTRKIHSGALVDGFAGRSMWPDMGTKMAEIGEATEERKTAVATSTAQMTPRAVRPMRMSPMPGTAARSKTSRPGGTSSAWRRRATIAATANRPRAASNQPAPMRSIPMNLKSTPAYWAVVASHMTQANQPTRTTSAARIAARPMAVLTASTDATRATTTSQHAGFWKPKLTSVWTWEMPASQGEMRARNRQMTTRTPRGEANARRGLITGTLGLGRGCRGGARRRTGFLEWRSRLGLFSHEIYLTSNRYSIQYKHAFCEWGEGELDPGGDLRRDQFTAGSALGRRPHRRPVGGHGR